MQAITKQNLLIVQNTHKSLKAQQWRSQYRGKGGQSAPLDSENNVKNRKKREKIRKKIGKSGRKGQKQEGSFTLSLLTNRAGYATEAQSFK